MPILEASDRTTMPSICDKQEWANCALVGSRSVVPNLSISMNRARAGTIQMDIHTSPNPPGACPLELEVEEVLLPIVDVIAELDRPRQGNVDVLQEAKVQRLADGILLVKDDGTAIVALLKSGDNLGRVIPAGRAAGLDEADLFGVALSGEVDGSVWLVWTGKNLGADWHLSCQH